jgi:hypothetical protein
VIITENPRKASIVAEEIQDLEKLIDSTNEMLKIYPRDRALQFTMMQDEGRRKRLLDELDASDHAIKTSDRT